LHALAFEVYGRVADQELELMPSKTHDKMSQAPVAEAPMFYPAMSTISSIRVQHRAVFINHSLDVGSGF
jgi:hypothetical protein